MYDYVTHIKKKKNEPDPSVNNCCYSNLQTNLYILTRLMINNSKSNNNKTKIETTVFNGLNIFNFTFYQIGCSKKKQSKAIFHCFRLAYCYHNI